MKERPILFSGPMVRAILDGRKTQTRRVCKRAYDHGIAADAAHPAQDGMPIFWWHIAGGAATGQAELTQRVYEQGERCPYGNKGDHLWVRETWRVEARQLQRNGPITYLIDYRCDPGSPELTKTNHVDAGRYSDSSGRYRPSIFMPRWASRLTLEITDVRVEQLQNITERDVVAEGIGQYTFACGAISDEPPDTRWKFIELWDELNSKRGYGWEVNPWVWVVSFAVAQEG